MNKTIVLIPHYNNNTGLIKSVSSIGNNESLDVLIVDDGSKRVFDEQQIINSFNGKGQIYFKYLQTNKGIEKALNAGLEFILNKKKHYYVARLDCGDICVKNRFFVQESFLDDNKTIDLIGSFVDFVDINGKFLYSLKLPTKDKNIRNKMYINAMHIHPTIMFRANILKTVGLYPEKYKAAEDYAFFFNVLKYCKVANINEILVKCELNPNGISSLQRKNQTKNRIKLIKENFYFGFYPVYGLFRAYLLHLLPLSFINKIKFYFKG